MHCEVDLAPFSSARRSVFLGWSLAIPGAMVSGAIDLQVEGTTRALIGGLCRILTQGRSVRKRPIEALHRDQAEERTDDRMQRQPKKNPQRQTGLDGLIRKCLLITTLACSGRTEVKVGVKPDRKRASPSRRGIVT